VSIFDTIAGAESGHRNIPASDPSSTASGFFQINNPTWQQFAPQAGVNLAQFPTAMSAPADVQTQVASVIPLGRWTNFAPATAAAVQRDFGTLNPSDTLGTINASHGGGTLAQTGVNTGGLSTPTQQGTGASNAPGGGTFGGTTGTTTDPLSGLDVPPAGTGYELNLGVQAPLAKFLSDTAQAAVKTITEPAKAFLGELGNWFTRGIVILLGLLLLAFALWRVMDPGGEKLKAAVSNAVKVA
jgi:hypothetical protein